LDEAGGSRASPPFSPSPLLLLSFLFFSVDGKGGGVDDALRGKGEDRGGGEGDEIKSIKAALIYWACLYYPVLLPSFPWRTAWRKRRMWVVGLGVPGWRAQKRRARKWEGRLTRGEMEAGKKALAKEEVMVVRHL